MFLDVLDGFSVVISLRDLPLNLIIDDLKLLVVIREIPGVENIIFDGQRMLRKGF